MNFSDFRHSSNVTVLVIGDLMLDNYLIGKCHRISPEAPVQIVEVEREDHLLGGAGNVINNLISLGASAGVLSVLGDDHTAVQIFDLLKRLKVHLHVITEKGRTSSLKSRIIVDKHQVVRFDRESSNCISEESEVELTRRFERIIGDYDIVVLSDYGKGLLTYELTRRIIEISNHNKKRVIVDPKGVNFEKYSGAYLLTPNRVETEKALGFTIDSYVSLQEALEQLKNTLSLEISLITLSEEGIAYFDGKFNRVPAKVKDVCDVTGAGDTVLATIAIGLALNIGFEKIVSIANLTAGIVVGKMGSATATIDELEELFLSHRSTFITKFSTILDIKKKIESYKNERAIRVVFTNGCFDILHYGHVSYLERAKQLGDFLVVGVNTDKSVQSIKGESRPINTELDRLKLLCALSSVDFVFLFDDLTPYDVIRQLEPDILVKGGDYSTEDIVGRDLVKEVAIIEFVDNYSSSRIIQKIREKN
jgi:D-beta-D-heptose 7-phosphate kinase/D-beta-D-heptose 1-phosphate adenosyltransferase